MKKLLVLCAFLLTVGNGWAQSEYRDGFVIKHNGDTIHGKVDFRGDKYLAQYCSFEDSKGIKTDFYPSDILGYRFNDGKYFVSKKINRKFYFLEFLVDGVVDIFYLRDEYVHDRYFIQSEEDEELREIPYNEEEKYIDGKLYNVKSTRHVGFLKYYMPSDKKFAGRIDQVGTVNHKSMMTLAKDYHEAVCDDYSCVVYEKKLPLIKTKYEYFIGGLRYQLGQSIDDSDNSDYFEFGTNFIFWLPRTNERWYFKTGAAALYGSSGLMAVIRSPALVSYQTPPLTSKHRFRLSTGNTIYTFWGNSIAFGVLGREEITLILDNSFDHNTMAITLSLEHTRFTDALVFSNKLRSVALGLTISLIF